MSRDRVVREQLVARGAKSLGDCELVSVLLGEGVAVGSALALAEKVLEEQSLASLAAMELSRLRQVGGIGIKRAAILAAALELGRRAVVQQADNQEIITSDVDVVRLFGAHLAALPHEEFWAICLSSSGRILDRARISQGGTSATVVDHKLIVKRAVEHLAPSLIVVHNHPSGSAEPSTEDLALTERLQAAAALFDITLLDHVVIAAGGHLSFRRQGLLK